MVGAVYEHAGALPLHPVRILQALSPQMLAFKKFWRYFFKKIANLLYFLCILFCLNYICRHMNGMSISQSLKPAWALMNGNPSVYASRTRYVLRGMRMTSPTR